MAEYTPLLAVIALVVIFGITLIVPWIRYHIAEPAIHLHGCPGQYTLLDTTDLDDPRNDIPRPPGADRDLNGDAYLCVQVIAGTGNGNTGVRINIKDNNRPPGT